MWPLRALSLLLTFAILVFPALPLSWFLAVDPVTGGPVLMARGHVTRTPLHLLWALEGFRRIPGSVRLVGFIGMLVLTFLPSARRPGRPAESLPRGPERRLRTPALTLAGGLIATTLCYLLRVSPARNLEFGDAVMLLREVGVGYSVASDVLTYNAFIALRSFLGFFVEQPTPLQAITLTSCLCGGVFVAAAIALSCTVGRSSAEKVTVLCGLVLAGYSVMFFGYVETTQLELAGMALYFAFAAKAVHGAHRPARLKYLVLALAGLALALMAHAAGILLLPSAAVLLWTDAAWPDVGLRRALWSKALLRNALLFVGLVALPYGQVVVVPYFLQGDFGNIAGGYDSVMFVPWHIDRHAPRPDCVYYSFLSGWHLADLTSALLVAAPLAIPLCLRAATWAFQDGLSASTAERTWLGVIGTAAAACFLVPLTWNHDFGMWGDWNLAACYLFPLNALAWSACVLTGRRRAVESASRCQPAVPLIAVQAVLALGMLLQLW